MSELSAEVDPSVSTERRRFMIAPASASVCEPFDRMAVTTAGSAVGMAATANATALRNSSWRLDAAVQAEADRDRERDAGDDEDLVRERVELLRQRGLLDRRSTGACR